MKFKLKKFKLTKTNTIFFLIGLLILIIGIIIRLYQTFFDDDQLVYNNLLLIIGLINIFVSFALFRWSKTEIAESKIESEFILNVGSQLLYLGLSVLTRYTGLSFLEAVSLGTALMLAVLSLVFLITNFNFFEIR